MPRRLPWTGIPVAATLASTHPVQHGMLCPRKTETILVLALSERLGVILGRAGVRSGLRAHDPRVPIGISLPEAPTRNRGPAAVIDSASSTAPQRTPPPAPKPGRLPYLAGLDGLRALAVIAVVLYHAGIDFMPAGFLGVEIFFVISGYLITALLLAERAAGAGVSLKRFWIRRARRLLPGLFFLLAGVLVYFALFLPGEVASIRGEALAAFAYVSNWAFIAQDASYFEQVGRPSPLLHLWSLAIEEQFYLLWPLIFVALTWLGGRRLLFPAILLGAIGATWLMATLYQPFDDVSRIYYGTDTRAAGLLVGAALAVVWRAGALPAPRRRLSIWLMHASGLGRLLRWSLDAAGLAALGGLVYIVVTFSEFQPSLYQGGFALVSVLTAIVIAATVAPGGTLGRAMGIAPLRWIGLRSYAIYLWHWPIFVVTRPDLDVSMGDTELLLMRLALTLLLAEISYRFVEMPVRRGALGRLWARVRAQEGRRWRREVQRGALAFPALAGGVALAFVVALAQPSDPPAFLPADRVATVVQEPPSLQTEARPPGPRQVAANAVAGPVASVFFADESLTATPASSTTERLAVVSVRTVAPQPVGDIWNPFADITTPASGSISARSDVALPFDAFDSLTFAAPETAELTAAASDPLDASPIPAPLDPEAEAGRLLTATPVLREPPPPPLPAFTAIGDSVMLGAASQMEEAFGVIGIDAEVARHIDPAIEVIRGYRDAGLLGETVILHLGNNGPMYPEQFQTLMEVLDGRTVVFLNVRVPRQWQDWNNNVIHEGVAQYSNATLIDWYGASDNKPDMFWGDGYHLRPDGALYYANLIATAVRG